MPRPEDGLSRLCTTCGQVICSEESRLTVVDLINTGLELIVLTGADGDKRISLVQVIILSRHNVQEPLTANLDDIQSTDGSLRLRRTGRVIHHTIGRSTFDIRVSVRPDELSGHIIIRIQMVESLVLLLHKVSPVRSSGDRLRIILLPLLLSSADGFRILIKLVGLLPILIEGIGGSIDAREGDEDTEVVELEDVAISLRAYCDADELGAEVVARLIAVLKLPLEEWIGRIDGPVGVAPAELLGGVDVIARLEGVHIAEIICTEVGGEVVDVLSGADIGLKRTQADRERAVVRISSDDLLHRDHLGSLRIRSSHSLVLSLTEELDVAGDVALDVELPVISIHQEDLRIMLVERDRLRELLVGVEDDVVLLLEDIDGLGDGSLILRVGGVGHREGEGVLIPPDLEGVSVRRRDGVVGDDELVEVVSHRAEHIPLIVLNFLSPLLSKVVIEGEEVRLIDIASLMDEVLNGVTGVRLAVSPELEVVPTGIGDVEFPILVYLIIRGI